MHKTFNNLIIVVFFFCGKRNEIKKAIQIKVKIDKYLGLNLVFRSPYDGKPDILSIFILKAISTKLLFSDSHIDQTIEIVIRKKDDKKHSCLRAGIQYYRYR